MAKILVVDDDKDIRRLCREELLEEGHEVVLASNGTEAMEKFEQDRPDAVTLDIVMTTLEEGIDILRRMKAVDQSVPIIMFTAYDFKDDLQVWAADGYVTKSSDLSEYTDVVRKLLSER